MKRRKTLNNDFLPRSQSFGQWLPAPSASVAIVAFASLEELMSGVGERFIKAVKAKRRRP